MGNDGKSDHKLEFDHKLDRQLSPIPSPQYQVPASK